MLSTFVRRGESDRSGPTPSVSPASIQRTSAFEQRQDICGHGRGRLAVQGRRLNDGVQSWIDTTSCASAGFQRCSEADMGAFAG